MIDELERESAVARAEVAFVESLRRAIAPLTTDIPCSPDAFIAWFEQLKESGPGQNDPLFPWLATTADARQMRWFLLQEVAGEGYTTATDLADWCVRKIDMPFRQAHHVAGSLVRLAEQQNKPLEALTLKEMQSVEPRITKDIFAVLGVQNSVKSRVSYGGTAPSNVKKQVARWRKLLARKGA